MQERRKVHRGRTYLGGRIAFNNRCSTMDCLVRNMSQDGAKIQFADLSTIPGEFDINIHHSDHSRRARIVWRDEAQAGIVFLKYETSSVVSIETARRINKLETDRKALEQRIADMCDPI